LKEFNFKRFVGIDWSGAEAESQAGIQVAQVHCQTKRIELIAPSNGRNWSRQGILKLLGSFETDCRTLVGLDFAFSVPWHSEEGIIPACLGKMEGVRDLWALIDHLCRDVAHFYGGPVWLSDESPFRPFIHLWSQTKSYERKVTDSLLLRKTEKKARTEMGLRPKSVYQMAGPQVGAGSFAGMRVLHALGLNRRSDIAIWPFDQIEDAMVVIVEVYPALFYCKAAKRRPTKSQVKSGAYKKIVGDVLQFYGCSYNTELPASVDAMDALISTAAICSLFQQASSLIVPRDADVSNKEGWILGVPAGERT
jgi:hypothetical protein